MPRSKSAKGDRSNLELAHHRMMASPTTFITISAALMISSFAVLLSVYSFLGTLNPYWLRPVVSLFPFGIVFYGSAKTGQLSLRFLKTAREIELKLHVDKTLEKYGIRGPFGYKAKKKSKEGRK